MCTAVCFICVQLRVVDSIAYRIDPLDALYIVPYREGRYIDPRCTLSIHGKIKISIFYWVTQRKKCCEFPLSLIVSTLMPTRSYHLSTARMWTRHYLTQTFSPTCLWELWFELWGLQTCWDQILDQGEILGQGRNFGLGWIFDQL